MSRRFLNFNLFLIAIFLISTVFPPSLLSYETSQYPTDHHSEREWIDESLDYKPVVYKKIRCPRCGMEFFYIPGKENPHSCWVHYETYKEELEDIFSEDNTPEEKIQKQLESRGLSGAFGEKTIQEGIEVLGEHFLEKKTRKGDSSTPQIKKMKADYYELRQKLVCPYDGYNFFPEGDILQDTKIMENALQEEPSIIEASFSKSIPFGISKDLRLFGYDLFIISEEERKKAETAKIEGGSISSLATVGMIKAAFGSDSGRGAFSPQYATEQATVLPVQPDYIIGPGDTLVINIWGSVQESLPVTVDGEGKILLPKAGPLYLWGLKLEDVEPRIKDRLNQFYTNFNLDVSMGKLRDIKVYVIGNVKKPGSYTISSQSTIFQALSAAFGPTRLGSLRRIKLIHTGEEEEEIDLYPFLLEGKKVEHSKIRSGDTIFVPAIGDVIAIAGNVKQPAIYETKSKVLLSDLLGYAGGITPTGDLQRIQVERVKDNEKRVMLDVELRPSEFKESPLKDISLQNGDIVIISPIVRLKHNFVSALGNVERPGDYALVKDMKVSELIKRAKGFLPGTYMSRAEISRVTKDRTRQIIPVNLDSIMLNPEEDMMLNEWDILIVYSEAEVKPPSYVEIDGAINRSGKYELTPNMKLSDLIFKAGGIDTNKVIRGAELFNFIPGEQPVVREIGLKCLSGGGVFIDKDIELCAGDALFVKSEPKLTERNIVTIQGEVRYPGTYSIKKGERLSSLIERTGSFTKEAFLEGAVFTRESIKKAQEEMRQRFIEKENRVLLEEQQSILLRTSEGAGASSRVSESLKIRRDMLDFISSTEIKGRMVINLMPISELKDTKYDIILEDGDFLKIPQIPLAITVIGSINNPTSVPFEERKGIEYYVRRTGGFTRHADRSGIYIVRANGEAINKFMMSKEVDRGDTIVVPQEFKYWTPPGQLFRDTIDILSRILVGVGIIAALD